MSQQVRIELRAAQPYAGIPVRVTMDGLSGAVDEAFPELFGWLAAQDILAAGPPFIRYLIVWRARAEHYLTNPSAEPDPAKWEVDVAYLAR